MKRWSTTLRLVTLSFSSSSLDSFYCQELRGGGREAGLNNGLVLLFECTEDFGLLRSLLSTHGADIWSDTVRGVGCIDHFVRSADIQASYCPPYWKYAVGEEGQWVTTLYRRGKVLRIDAASRGEIVYNILEDVLDQCPKYDNFVRWYCYPSLSDTVTSMARDLEMIKQMVPLQTHVDRQLFNARVQCVLEVSYQVQLLTRQKKCLSLQFVNLSSAKCITFTTFQRFFWFRKRETRNFANTVKLWIFANGFKFQIEIGVELVTERRGSVIPPLDYNRKSSVEKLKWLTILIVRRIFAGTHLLNPRTFPGSVRAPH